MLDLGMDAGFQVFDLIEYRVQPVAQVQLVAPGRPHRNMPAS